VSTPWRRAQLARLRAVRAAVAPPEALPDIDLGELVDLDAEIPCEWQTEPCPQPARWHVRVTCRCGMAVEGLICDLHHDFLVRASTGAGVRLVIGMHGGPFEIKWRRL
jgi:hypothetical protein